MAALGLRVRFWIESILATVTGVLAVVTIFWHDWIETVFGVDPDHGNGSAEWLAVLALAVVTVAWRSEPGTMAAGAPGHPNSVTDLASRTAWPGKWLEKALSRTGGGTRHP